jgi:hypothetical protein
MEVVEETLVERFEAYFKYPDPNHYILKLSDRAVACKNAKKALARLGYARAFGDDAELLTKSYSRRSESFRRRPVIEMLMAASALERDHDLFLPYCNNLVYRHFRTSMDRR